MFAYDRRQTIVSSSRIGLPLLFHLYDFFFRASYPCCSSLFARDMVSFVLFSRQFLLNSHAICENIMDFKMMLLLSAPHLIRVSSRSK